MAFTDVDEYIDPTPGKKRRIPQVLPLMLAATLVNILLLFIVIASPLSEAPVSEDRTWKHMKEKLKQVTCSSRQAGRQALCSETAATKNIPILMPSSFGKCTSYVNVPEDAEITQCSVLLS